jgi:ribosomal protein S21
MQVVVKNGNVDRAMRTLKKKLQKEGLLINFYGFIYNKNS